ncbi:MAG: RluA family pseudouridine synthase [Bacillota bacterium]|nr:RluA family pseudouridine synthase [Bacillota bacterium]
MTIYTVLSSQNNMTLGAFLRSKGYSAGMLKTMRQKGGITVNGEFRRQIETVKAGEKVVVDFPDKATPLIPNGELKVPIVYENENIIIFDKPDNMLVHPAAKGFKDALGNYFVHLYPDTPFRPLGRLDRHTTGLCFIAKNRLTAVSLGNNLEKEYIALAEGIFSRNSGTVNAPMIRVSGSVITRKVDFENGQTAITHYEVLERLKDHTLLRLKLETGRTHQIRVHMSFLGHPLAGDELYGGHKNIMLRQALHCQKIIFFQENSKITVEGQMPPDLAKCINYLKNDY